MSTSIAIDQSDIDVLTDVVPDVLPLSQLQQAQLRQAQGLSGQLSTGELASGQLNSSSGQNGPPNHGQAKQGPRGRNRHGRGLVRVVGEWIAIIAVALSVALLVRATVVQAFWIPSTSMTPTLKVGDRLLVDKVSFQVREIHRGEIIVFERPATLKEDFKDLIKRVIGLPGDTVEGHDGGVFVNGKRLPEPYLPAGLTTKDFPPQQVPIDNYFVMGDNREVSWDSRYWGTVERKLVVGKAIVRVWPPSQIGRL
jgi:signal peptidase I